MQFQTKADKKYIEPFPRISWVSQSNSVLCTDSYFETWFNGCYSIVMSPSQAMREISDHKMTMKWVHSIHTKFLKYKHPFRKGFANSLHHFLSIGKSWPAIIMRGEVKDGKSCLKTSDVYTIVKSIWTSVMFQKVSIYPVNLFRGRTSFIIVGGMVESWRGNHGRQNMFQKPKFVHCS